MVDKCIIEVAYMIFFLRRIGTGVVTLVVFLVLWAHPDCAWALQSHGAPEGLYVHQMAHIHFFGALLYLYWDIRRSSFEGRGWNYLQWFCILMALWNVVAFAGHAASLTLDMSHFSSGYNYLQATLLAPITLNKFIFYLAKFDHLICVPALYLLFIGLRSFYRDVEKQEAREAKK